MNIRVLVVTICFVYGTFNGAGTQDQPQRGSELPEFKTIMALLQQGRPAEAEQLLDEANWRSSNETFDLGKSKIPAYGFYSPLLVAAYIRINHYAEAERLAKDGVEWSEKRYGSTALQAPVSRASSDGRDPLNPPDKSGVRVMVNMNRDM